MVVDSWFVKNEYGDILVDEDKKNYECGLCIEYCFLVIEPFVFILYHHSLLVCFMLSYAFTVVSKYKQKNTI